MAIGPVQLLVLGFSRPDFHGEIIAELERLRESDTVRVIDSLAVYKDAQGEVEVEHLSNLTQDEAIELGSKVGALIGLGIEGEEGFVAGAEAGAEAAASGAGVFTEEEAWDVLEEIPDGLRRRARPARAPLGRPAARRHRARGRVPHLRRVHQPARPRRDRPRDGRGGAGAARPRGRGAVRRLTHPHRPTRARSTHVRRPQSRPPHSRRTARRVSRR